MGCASSLQIYEPKSFQNKMLVWFLGGGPGTPKQQVAQYLIERYKFKYLSTVDLMHFEEGTNSIQSTEIKKCIEEKQQFSSNLVIRVLIKVVNLYGPRKYLVDNFPRNQADVLQFQQTCKKYHSLQVHGYLMLDLQQSQMKESGIKALRQLKKDENLQNIEKQVRAIIESYRNKSKAIFHYYKQQGKLIMAQYINNNVDSLFETVRRQFAGKQISPVHMVPFCFIDGNDQQQIVKFSLQLSRIFGFKYWSIQQLIEQAKNKPQTQKYISSKKVFELQSDFLVELIFKKIQKFNFKGRYLISGFPRTEEDAKSFRVKFRSQIEIVSYVGCLHTPTTQNEKQAFEKMERYFQTIEETPSILINSSERSFNQIQDYMRKFIAKNEKKSQTKLIIAPKYNNEGQEYWNKIQEWSQFYDFDELVKRQIKSDSITSDLLNSCLTLGHTIPSYIAINILINTIQNSNESKPIMVVGFPQNTEQLKILLSKSNSMDVLSGLFVQPKAVKKTDNIKEKMDLKLKNYQSLQSLMSYSCEKFMKINEKTTYQELKSFIDVL